MPTDYPPNRPTAKSHAEVKARLEADAGRLKVEAYKATLAYHDLIASQEEATMDQIEAGGLEEIAAGGLTLEEEALTLALISEFRELGQRRRKLALQADVLRLEA